MEEQTNVEVDVLEDNQTQDELGTTEAESSEESQEQVGEDLSGDDADGGEGGDSLDQGSEARKARAQAQIERLKEEKRKLQEENRKLKKDGGVAPSNTDMIAKAYLASTFGINDPTAQEDAIERASKFDMTIDEYMEDQDFREKTQSYQKRLAQQRKVAATTGTGNQRKKGAEDAAAYFKKHNSFPEWADLDVQDKAIDLIRNRKTTIRR